MLRIYVDQKKGMSPITEHNDFLQKYKSLQNPTCNSSKTWLYGKSSTFRFRNVSRGEILKHWWKICGSVSSLESNADTSKKNTKFYKSSVNPTQKLVPEKILRKFAHTIHEDHPCQFWEVCHALASTCSPTTDHRRFTARSEAIRFNSEIFSKRISFFTKKFKKVTQNWSKAGPVWGSC